VSRSVLYFDLASPYAYLAVARAADMLPEPPELRPILLGAIFAMRGYGSWAETASRATQMAEIEARARRYGLPPLRWPVRWPANSLAAMRAATWAEERDRVEPFARAAYHAAFARGEDLADLPVLQACAEAAGLDADIGEIVQRPEIKAKLRDATSAAWEAGVRGAPTLIVDGAVFYGDDQLELAAQRGGA
jgi:2-hydroxychromene-2-carboxylate isomerase